VTSSSLLFVCLFCDISNGAFDKVFKLQVIFMKSACWAVFNKRERYEAKLGWFPDESIQKYSAIKYYWVYALNYLLPLFFTFYSVLNVAIENMQSGM